MVLDTGHFGVNFKDRLLSALSDAGPLDEQIDGLLVHGENFQALNLLQARYSGQVQCVFIDPPYNTNSDEFLYKGRLSGIELGFNAFRQSVACTASYVTKWTLLYADRR